MVSVRGLCAPDPTLMVEALRVTRGHSLPGTQVSRLSPSTPGCG